MAEKSLVFVENNRVVTDSLIIAEMFGKRHDNVMRDIENQMEMAGREFSLLNFEESNYESRGKRYPKFNLTEEAFTLVVFSYNTKEAVQSKIKFIQEFKRMREQLQNKFSLPQNYKEALLQLVNQVEQNERLVVENAQKDQIIQELKPKATYYDLILQNHSLLSISVIAKDYGMSATAMNKLLHKLGVQYNLSGTWLLYQKHADKGYTSSKTQNYSKSDGTQGSRLHTYWTQKGRLFLYELLKSEGILPMIEREEIA